MQTEAIQKICLSLPAVTEDIKWDHDLCFSVGGKMFCVIALEPPFKCSFKVPDEEFEELANSDGFIPAPYMARAKWVTVIRPSAISKEDWIKYIHRSYELVKARLTKKQRKESGI